MPKELVFNPEAYETLIAELLTKAIQGDLQAKKELEENYRKKDYPHLKIFADYLSKNYDLVSNSPHNLLDNLAGNLLDDILCVDTENAQIIFQLAQMFAEKGAGWAYTILGYYYESNFHNIVPRDIKKAYEAYSKAEKNCPRAKAHLGRLYARGEFVPHDMKKAVTLWQDASKNNDPLAQALLGSLYQTGYADILPKNEKLAKDYLTNSIEQNHHTGYALYANYLQNTLTELFAKPDDLEDIRPQIMMLIKEICEKYKVAVSYNSPIGNALYGNFLLALNFISPQAAIKYYDFAINHYEPKGFAFKALYCFSKSSSFGYEITNQKVMNEGFELIKKVQDQKDPEVCATLGKLYFMGQGFSQNTKKAEELLKIAAEYEHPTALILLAQLYNHPQTLHIADGYLFKAAKKNDPMAQFLLGMDAFKNRNNKQAIYYFIRSARSGCQPAIQQLMQLNIPLKNQIFHILKDFQVNKYFSNINSKIVHFEEGIIYGEGAEGNCGFTALGVTREQAGKMLIENANDLTVQELCAPEIFQTILVEDEFLRLFSALPVEKQQQYASVKSILELYKVQIKTQTQDEQEIKEFCRQEIVLKAFVECYIRGKGWLNAFRNASSTTDAIAYLCKIRVVIWEPTNQKNPQTNEIQLRQVAIQPNPEVYNYETKNTFHLLFLENKGHFNILYEASVDKVNSSDNKKNVIHNTANILNLLNNNNSRSDLALDEEDEELKLAIALSKSEASEAENHIQNSTAPSENKIVSTADIKSTTDQNSESIDEDEELKAALALSLTSKDDQEDSRSNTI